MDIETFATARLRAVPIAKSDLADLVRLHLDPDVSRFIGGVRSQAETSAYLGVQIEHWGRHGFGLWTLRTHAGDFVGRAGLRYVTLDDREELEIAYTLAKDWWGVGLASEAASALTGIWRDALADRSLVGIVEVGNGASENVLLKLGFQREGMTTFHGLQVNTFRMVRD